MNERLLVAVAAATPILFAAACTEAPKADPTNAAQVAAGKIVYAAHCASCHGADLEGQRDWKSRNPNGRMPAPPHDDSGHTWHHADDILLGIIKVGVAPPYAPAGYQSDMPAFAGTLTDKQMLDVLAYIKSRWSPRMREAQSQITRQQRK